jgi:hypothetical protein
MDEETIRQFDHLSLVDETALVVLKGYLLIEDALESIISSFVLHREIVEEAKLSFFQKVHLARSISVSEYNNEMWEIAGKLNSLRNEIAHSLHSPKRVTKTKNLIDLFVRLSKDDPEVDEIMKEKPEHYLVMLPVALLLGFLQAFRRHVEIFRV